MKIWIKLLTSSIILINLTLINLASANTYKAFILYWIDSYTTSDPTQAPFLYASGRLELPGTWSQAIARTKKKCKGAITRCTSPSFEQELFLLDKKYLLACFSCDIHNKHIDSPPSGSVTSTVRSILTGFLPKELFSTLGSLELLQFKRLSMTQPFEDAYQNILTWPPLPPCRLLAYIGHPCEIKHWLTPAHLKLCHDDVSCLSPRDKQMEIKFIRTTILHDLVKVRDAEVLNSFFNAVNYQRLSPEEQMEIIGTIDSKFANNHTSLHAALSPAEISPPPSVDERHAMVKMLINTYPAAYRQKLLTKKNGAGWSPLHFAAFYSPLKTVQMICNALEAESLAAELSTKTPEADYPADLSYHNPYHDEVTPYLTLKGSCTCEWDTRRGNLPTRQQFVALCQKPSEK